MNLEQFLLELGPLSPVKRQLLERLWQEGGPGFPRGWVSSKELLSLSDQKYFDRRLRELRDEKGCEIETRIINGETVWRLASAGVVGGFERSYLTAKQKKKLFLMQKYTCQICGKQLSQEGGGTVGAQADHKIPLIRGGSHKLENWQTLCVGCNVAKRRACQGCSEECALCPWAFPERSGVIISIGISKEVYERIAQLTGLASLAAVGDFVVAAAINELARQEQAVSKGISHDSP